MSAITLHSSDAAVGRAPPGGAILRIRTAVVLSALLFPILFYLSLLAILVVIYGHWPNYFTAYDWIGNAIRIIASTGSVADMAAIILDEWLIETGYINYAYGRGVTEWSMAIIPHKVALVALAGALIGLNSTLLLRQPAGESISRQVAQFATFGILTGAGTLFASIPNATVFSVVHCATPSWVGSLAVLGIDSYGIFPLEPYGPLIAAGGFGLLLLSTLLLVRAPRAAGLGQTALAERTPC